MRIPIALHLMGLTALLLSACGAAAPQAQAAAEPTTAPRSTMTTAAASPTSTPTAAPSPTPTAAPALCSPLQGIPLARMPEIVTNPFHPPAPGSDDPHQGVDLSYFLDEQKIALPGLPVQAILSGTVTGISTARFPYGNTVLIETPLQLLPAAWQQQLAPEPPHGTPQPPNLTCPAFTQPPSGDASRQSVYVLYAHLQQPPALQPGQAVTCGQMINTVGSSGNALNPHLHVEVRLGPAQTRLGSMAHYDASATQDEMATYCLWRISGMFQLVDPMKLLALQP